MKEIEKYRLFYQPPGGILMWILIYLELITFGIALVSMVYEGELLYEMYRTSSSTLNKTYGVFNTVILLTSGFFMAMSLKKYQRGDILTSKRYLLGTMIFGVLFLVIKTVEYYAKIEAAIYIDTNVFYTYYWLLTLFHVIHVVVGLVILGIMYIHFDKAISFAEDYESGAAFWHMCDLIWMLLFSVLYLLY
jgi:nitric oxide reductase NorE protein